MNSLCRCLLFPLWKEFHYEIQVVLIFFSESSIIVLISTFAFLYIYLFFIDITIDNVRIINPCLLEILLEKKIILNRN